MINNQMQFNLWPLNKHLAELRLLTSGKHTMYIDDSNDGHRVASTVVSHQPVASILLLSNSFIINSEVDAILHSSSIMDKSKFTICSDSPLCMLAIESCKTQKQNKKKDEKQKKSTLSEQFKYSIGKS